MIYVLLAFAHIVGSFVCSVHGADGAIGLMFGALVLSVLAVVDFSN